MLSVRLNHRNLADPVSKCELIVLSPLFWRFFTDFLQLHFPNILLVDTLELWLLFEAVWEVVEFVFYRRHLGFLEIDKRFESFVKISSL